MNRPFLALLIASLAFLTSPKLCAEMGLALPSLVQNAGWPLEAKGTVRDLKAVRLTSSLETEQAVLVDDVLYLAFRPGRFSEFVELASGVQSMQVLPNTDGTDSLLLVRKGDVVLLRWNWMAAGFVETSALPADMDDWKGVGRMWVQEVPGGQHVYGYDGGAGKVRKASHSSGVWTILSSVPCQGALRDLVFVELLASSPGEEMVWLEKYTLYVKAADGEQVLEKLPAHPTDAIAVMRHLDVASGDLLVRSYVEGGVQKINVRNETLSSPGYSLGARDCTAILPRQGDTYGDHLLLTRGGVGDVDLLEVHISTGTGGLILERSTTGDWLDTHEDSEQRPIQAASLVDLDLDGQEDLIVAVLNGHSLELRNVMTSDLGAQRWRNLEVDEPNLQSLGNGEFEVSVTMQVPEVLASTTVQVDMWALRDPGTPEETIHSIGRQWVTIQVGQTEHEFAQAFDGSGWDPANSHYEMSFVSVELDTSGVVTRLFPSQGLAWAPPGAQSAMLQLGLCWLNFAAQQAGAQRHRARRVSGPRQQPVSERVVQ